MPMNREQVSFDAFMEGMGMDGGSEGGCGKAEGVKEGGLGKGELPRKKIQGKTQIF